MVKCNQQDQRFLNLEGVSFAWWISFSMSAVFWVRLNQGGGSGECHLAGIHIFSAIIICMVSERWYAVFKDREWCSWDCAGEYSSVGGYLSNQLVNLFPEGLYFGSHPPNM